MRLFLLHILSCFSLIFKFHNIACSGSLEQMSDDDLLNLIRTENYVSVLFTKKDCEECDELEDVLYHIREDLVDSLNAWVVKVVNSQLVRIYNPSKEPALVFFRHGVPLLYDGEINDELILHSFTENKEPCVRELNDDNFEHLTQVSTGATTGDWFVLFYSTDCVECQYLQARWESVCAQLKSRLNIARINKQTSGKVTSRRFGVTQVPSFLFNVKAHIAKEMSNSMCAVIQKCDKDLRPSSLTKSQLRTQPKLRIFHCENRHLYINIHMVSSFRLGKLYRYSSIKYDVASLSKFPVETYLKARIEPISPPKDALEDFFLGVLEFIREFSFIFKLGTMVIGVLVVVSVAYRMNTNKESKKTQKRSKTK